LGVVGAIDGSRKNVGEKLREGEDVEVDEDFRNDCSQKSESRDKMAHLRP
jgi:hypothetical protein